jgi:hypothetical protein
LRRAIEAQAWMRHTLLVTHARLGLAHLYLEWGRPDDALAELCPVLAELEQREMPGVLLQEGRPVVKLLQLALNHHLAPALVSRALAMFGPEINTPLPAPGPVVLPGDESLSLVSILGAESSLCPCLPRRLHLANTPLPPRGMFLLGNDTTPYVLVYSGRHR